VLDARVACLGRARRELTALTELLANADRQLADRAVEAVDRLRDPASCRVALDPPPALPMRDELDRAVALYAAGRGAEAEAIAARTIAETPVALAPQLVAEALALRGRWALSTSQFAVAEGYLFDALAAAERARDDHLVAAVWVWIVVTTGAQEHKFELAGMARRAADGALARIDVDVGLTSQYAYVLGTTYLAEGKLAAAREQLGRALELCEANPERLGDASGIHNALCSLEIRAQHYDAARAHCTKGIALLEKRFGPDHPSIATDLNTLGGLELEQRHFDAAESAFARGAKILEHRGDTDSIDYALAISNLGSAALYKQDYARATANFTRARDLFAAHHPDHPQRVIPLQGLADTAVNSGDLAAGIAAYEQAIAVLETTYAKTSREVMDPMVNLAIAYRRHHDLKRAEATLREVIARASTVGDEGTRAMALDSLGSVADDRGDYNAGVVSRVQALAALEHADNPYLQASALYNLSDDYLHLGQPQRAIDPLERSLAIIDRDPTAAEDGAMVRLELARALWDGQRDRARAVQLARDARAALARISTPGALELRPKVDAWLAAHPK
jgi:tetratricopeptide (TPR) repeat protein